jgi:patatin-like phospholipase/acyl hydrolase|tara:strand:+ start:3707 stop:4723 length:1017 start_codon:yes stop_codon:yes gene_type:complete
MAFENIASNKKIKKRIAEGKPIRVLSIDGGGMRGIIPATYLETMENISGLGVSELFDVMVGTSTGAILSVGLTVANEKNKPKYKASDFVKLYQNMGSVIFHKKHSMFKVLDGIFRPSYDPNGYEKLLEEYFGETTISEALTEIVVPSIELQDMKMHIFTRSKARKESIYDFKIREIIRAATAAPSFFPAADLNDVDGKSMGTFVDAGLSTNNPGMIALVEAKKLAKDANFLFVSLGTGAISKPIDAMKAKNWGEVEWLKSIFDLQGDAQSSYTEIAISTFLENNKNNSYHRFQIDLHRLPIQLDDTKPKDIEELRVAAIKATKEQFNTINQLTQRLME